MQRDLRANEIDWVFCWRTSTGDVHPGARDAAWNGKPVRYQPSGTAPERGLRTIVRGRVRTCPLPPTGPRLDGQGAISRMCMFVSGYVHTPTLVPARTEGELAVLRDAARAAVLSGAASAWALGVIRGRGEERFAIHISASLAIVTGIAQRVDAPWTLDVREKPAGTWVKGAQILCRDREGSVLVTLEADSVFDNALLPALASAAPLRTSSERKGGGVIEIGWPHPTGPDAWERWVKAEVQPPS
jgi:hypothetical protein